MLRKIELDGFDDGYFNRPKKTKFKSIKDQEAYEAEYVRAKERAERAAACAAKAKAKRDAAAAAKAAATTNDIADDT